jgi:putative ABC transport system permease protein
MVRAVTSTKWPGGMKRIGLIPTKDAFGRSQRARHLGARLGNRVAPILAQKAFSSHDLGDHSSAYMPGIARLRPGVTIERARAELAGLAFVLGSEFPATNQHRGVDVVPLEEQILGRVRPAFRVLLGSVAAVLMVAWANVAGLLLGRGVQRRREFAVRAALGGSRARLLRQLFTESAIMAALGGSAGVALAFAGVRALHALAPAELPRLDSIAVDGRVLGFAVAATIATAVLFGLVPALRFSRARTAAVLRSSGVAGGGRERTRLRAALVAGEVAVALVLLVGAGLLLRSFTRLLANDLGFTPHGRASLQLFLSDRNPTPEAQWQRVMDLAERFAAVAGVTEVGVVSSLPFHPQAIGLQSDLRRGDRPEAAAGEGRVHTMIANGPYFQMMGIPLRRGRPFQPTDRGGPAVAIINEALVRKFFAGEDPIGKQVSFGVLGPPRAREIVGVVGDVRPAAFDSDPRPEVFVPFDQVPFGGVTFVVQVAGDAERMLPTLREQVWAVDPGQTIYHSATVDGLVAATLVGRRFNLLLLGLFAAVALVLALGGIYSLVSFATAQRASEFGIRKALGARAGDIVSLVLRESLALALVGIVAGLAVALALSRTLAHLLYGVSPFDAPTYAAVALLLLAFAVTVAAVPATRAARGHPARVLRQE